MDTQDSDIYKFSENAQLHVNESENMTRTESDCEPLQHKYNSNTCQRQCPFIEKISEVLYNPVKYAMKVQR